MDNLHELARRLMALDDRITACMKCGMCQSVCPMFGASGKEADVARGKLFLINNMAHELLKDPEALADKLGLEATDEDVRAEFEKANVDDVDARIEEFKKGGQLPAIRESIRRSKAVDWMVENAPVTVVDEIAEARAKAEGADSEDAE